MRDLSSETLESAILGALVDSFALRRAALVEDVIFEWTEPGSPPSSEAVNEAVDELFERQWLHETAEADDCAEQFFVLRLTEEGKAEWRRRNPLVDRLDTAWVMQSEFIYAPSEEIADRQARFWYEEIGSGEVDWSKKSIEPWTYELDDTGDVIHGARAVYPRARRASRLWKSFRSRIASLLTRSPRRRA